MAVVGAMDPVSPTTGTAQTEQQEYEPLRLRSVALQMNDTPGLDSYSEVFLVFGEVPLEC